MFTPYSFIQFWLGYGLPGYGGGGESLPAIALTGFWMEPTSGDSATLAVGEALGAVITGAPAKVDGPVYSGGTLAAIANGAGKRISYPNLTGKPFVDINTSFWVAALFRCANTPANEGMCGNGAATTSDPGFRLLLNSTNISVGFCDGAVRPTISPVLGTGSALELNVWHIVIVEVIPDVASGTVTARTTFDGYGRYSVSQGQRVGTGYTLSGAIVPSKSFTVGDSSATGALPFDGDICIAVGEHPVPGEFLDDDTIELLSNHERFRLWSDFSSYPVSDNIKETKMFAPTQTSISVVAETDYQVTINILDSSYNVAATANATPVSGFAKATLTGLTADTEYRIEYVQSGRKSIRQSRFRTLPTGNDWTFAVSGCSKWEEGES